MANVRRMQDYIAQTAGLEAMLAFRDKQIKQLRSENARKDQKIKDLSAECVSKSLAFLNLQDLHREDREKLQAVGQEMRTLILALSSMEADTRLIRASVRNDSEAHMEEWRRAEFDRLLREFEALTPVRAETPEPQDAEPEDEEDEQDAEPWDEQDAEPEDKEDEQDAEPVDKEDEQDAQTPAPQDEQVKRQLEEFAERTAAYQKQQAEDKLKAQQKREAAEAAEREALEERRAEQDRVAKQEAARKEAQQLAKEAEKQKREAARRKREDQRLRKAERRAQRQALAAEPVAEPVPDVPEVPDTWEQLAPEQSSPVVEQPPEEKGQSPVVEQPPEEKGQSPVVEQPPEEKGRSLPGREHPQARSIAVALLVNQRRREKQADRWEKFTKIVQEVFDKTDNHDFTILSPNHTVYMALSVYTQQCIGIKAYALERKYGDRSKYRLVAQNTVGGVEYCHTSPWVNPANIVFWLNEPTFVDACKDFFGFESASNDTPDTPEFIDYMFKNIKHQEAFRDLKLRPVKDKKDNFDLPLQQITVATGETVIGPMLMMILWFRMGKIFYLAGVEADA